MEQNRDIVAQTSLPEVKKVARKFLVPIYLTCKKKEKKDGREIDVPASKIITLTPRQYDVVTSFAKCWNYEQVATETGLKKSSVERILRHPEVRKYIEEVRHRVAAKLDTNLPWLIGRLRKSADGESELTDSQKFALKEIVRVLSPKVPSVALQFNSYYEGNGYSTEGEIEDAWAKRKEAAT